jgi:MFS family permease
MALSFSVLKIRDFRLLLLTRLFGTMSLSGQAVIVGWQVYSLTKDPFMLGLTGLAEAVPAIFCAMFAGYWVDKNRPHTVFMTAAGLVLLNMTMLMFVAGGIIHVTNILYWIFTGIIISGLGRSFFQPSSFALQAHILPRTLMPAASSWLITIFQIGAVTGPALAGLVYGGYSVRAAWFMVTLFMCIEFIAIIAMSKKTRLYQTNRVTEAFLKSVSEGWKFILNSRVLLSVMALDMFAVLFGGAVAMLPAFADQILHVGSEGLGALRAAPALGAGLTALALALWPMKQIRASVLLIAIAGFGFCMIGFALSTVFWISLLMLALSGVFDSVSMVIRATIMQLLTPDHMRGRVSSVNSMFIISSNEIGAFESGLAARLLGLVPSVIFGGIGTLLVVSVTALSPKLRKTVVTASENVK